MYFKVYINAFIIIVSTSLIIYLFALPAWHSWFAIDDSTALLCSRFSVLELLFDRATSNFCSRDVLPNGDRRLT